MKSKEENTFLKPEDFEKRLVEQFIKLIYRADLDKLIGGDSYWEFTDRKIEVIDPKNIKYNKKKGIIIQPRRLTKQKLYGKSILEKKELKNEK